MTGLELRERTTDFVLGKIPTSLDGELDQLIFDASLNSALHGPPVEFLIEALEKAHKSMRSAGMYEADYVLDDLKAIRDARGNVTDER